MNTECKRCGGAITPLGQRRMGPDPTMCGSCQAQPMLKVFNGRDYCEPWTGEVNDDFQPIDSKGQLFRPGERRCRHSDCVREAHIIGRLTPRQPKRKQRPKPTKATKPTQWSLEGTLRILEALSDLKR